MKDEVSALEQRRLANIARNASVLEALAVPALTPAEGPSSGRGAKRRAEAKNNQNGAVRRSSRLAQPRGKDAGGIADELAFYRSLEGRSVAERPERRVRSAAPRAKAAVVGGVFAPDVELGRVPPKEGTPMPSEWAALFEDAAIVKAEDGAFARGARLADVPLTLRGPSVVRKVAQDRVYCAALHPSAERVLAAVGTKYGYLVFWDATRVVDEWAGKAPGGAPHDSVAQGTAVHVALHSESLFAVRYARDGATAYTGGYDNFVRTVDTAAGGGPRAYGAAAYVHGAHKAGLGEWICAMDVRQDGTLVFTDTDGHFVCADVRAGPKPAMVVRLHERKAGGLAACPHRTELVATSSLDGSVCVWDVRKLGGGKTHEPLFREQYGRAVTAVAWDPHCPSGRIASTCWDDTLRIHSDVHNPRRTSDATLSISHNNQTGRWITPFRPVWDPKTPSNGRQSRFFIGSMDRALDAVQADGRVESYRAPDLLTSQPAANAVHASRDLVLSGTASGRALLWLPA